VKTIADFNQYGEDLERLLILRTSPVAVKMLEKEEDIPAGAYRPKRDKGVHLAQCQAFALSRRDKVTVAMLKEDHWCPAALMAYGLVERPAVRTGHPYDSFEFGKYVGILTAPLKKATFKPDVVIIYSNTAQLRSLLLSMKIEDLHLVNGHFFPPSCAYAVVHVMLTGHYWAVLPDPGEYQRALTGEDEMMFGVPADKMERLLSGLKQGESKDFSYAGHNMLMMVDFPHPDFYKKMFKGWGLEVKDETQDD
jgi:uncharacterized protein (DUF169 family)